ncbi:MAG: pilus assembly protein [Nevskiaceae bacterium]|nr:MAG: pilus assembly protein [Nevskiaceae bacterium]TBR73740.1 MAG: pilus assembly protein [Nevskiaceae bacterium]
MRESQARRRQSGAAAIEFAFVFPLLFALMYATIVYGYVFFAQQTINLVAQECAKAAVAAAPYDSSGKPIPPDYATAATTYFNLAKKQGPLTLFPAGVTVDLVDKGLTLVPGTGNGQIYTLEITLTGLTGKTGAFPTISLGGIMGIHDVPPMPQTLTASASVRVS